MSEIKHITILNELPVGARFTVDAFPGKMFEVKKVDYTAVSHRCDGCCFLHVTEVEGLPFIDCDVCFCCRSVDRKDKTAVIFKEVDNEPDIQNCKG